MTPPNIVMTPYNKKKIVLCVTLALFVVTGNLLIILFGADIIEFHQSTPPPPDLPPPTCSETLKNETKLLRELSQEISMLCNEDEIEEHHLHHLFPQIMELDREVYFAWRAELLKKFKKARDKVLQIVTETNAVHRFEKNVLQQDGKEVQFNDPNVDWTKVHLVRIKLCENIRKEIARNDHASVLGFQECYTDEEYKELLKRKEPLEEQTFVDDENWDDGKEDEPYI